MTSIKKERFNNFIGKRIQLIRTTDQYTTIEPFTLGTVTYIDDVGTIFVDWDNGSSLGLIPGVDQYRIIHD